VGEGITLSYATGGKEGGGGKSIDKGRKERFRYQLHNPRNLGINEAMGFQREGH